MIVFFFWTPHAHFIGIGFAYSINALESRSMINPIFTPSCLESIRSIFLRYHQWAIWKPPSLLSLWVHMDQTFFFFLYTQHRCRHWLWTGHKKGAPALHTTPKEKLKAISSLSPLVVCILTLSGSFLPVCLALLLESQGNAHDTHTNTNMWGSCRIKVNKHTHRHSLTFAFTLAGWGCRTGARSFNKLATPRGWCLRLLTSEKNGGKPGDAAH